MARNQRIPLQRSQIYEILNGGIREPPALDFVLAFVGLCAEYARTHGRVLTQPTDSDWWRLQHGRLVDILDDSRRADRLIRSGPSGAVATRSLPSDITQFVGRKARLQELVDWLTSDQPFGVVQLIHGMPGVGKTALAIHAAHVARSAFVDGQMFLPMNGYALDRQPLTASEALAALLKASGVPAVVMPLDLGSRAALWRHRTADKRILLVLDDALGPEQVRELIPASPMSRVLITSRRRMPGLVAAHDLQLDVLSAEDAAALFLTLAGERHAAEPDLLRDLVTACGRLAMALVVVAGRLRTHPTWTIAHLLEELRHAQHRLPYLQADDVAVAAAFELSCRALEPLAGRMFRLLAVHPGVDFDGYAAAALGGTNPDTANGLLEDLYLDHLLEEVSPGRFRFHDLVGEFAERISRKDTSTGRVQAAERLLDYYHRAAVLAGQQFPSRPGTDSDTVPASSAASIDLPPKLTSLSGATDWLGAEIENIQCCMAYAATARPEFVSAVSAATHGFLRQMGPWESALSMHRTAVAVARGRGDAATLAVALAHLGAAHYLLDDYPSARAALGEAITLFDTVADARSAADARTQLGVVFRLQGDSIRARELLERALSTFDELDDLTGRTTALTQLGIVARLSGHYREARDSLLHAEQFSCRQPNQTARAVVLNELGVVHYLLGDHPAAHDTLRRALAQFQELGDRLGQATSLNYLGEALHRSGQVEAAIASLHQAQRLFQDLGERLGYADSTCQLGVALRLAGSLDEAIDTQQQAMSLFEELGNRLGVATARNELGVTWHRRGQHDKARPALLSAITDFRELGYEPGLAEALNNSGELLADDGDLETAAAHHREALPLAQSHRQHYETARALEGIWRTSAPSTKPQATSDLQEALDLYRKHDHERAERLLRDFPFLATPQQR